MVPCSAQGGLDHPPIATNHGNEGDIDVSTWVGKDVSTKVDGRARCECSHFMAYDDEKYVCVLIMRTL
jgi:hypothetical protein